MSDLMEEPRTDELELGRCCACEVRGPHVRNILMLETRAPTPGKGWGCLVCELPMDGANAVLCDACLESGAAVRFVCDGYPKDDVRVPIEECTGTFGHDYSRHQDELADEPEPGVMIVSVCIGCGCDDLHACDDGGCYWLRLDEEEQLGVCSKCPDHVARFAAGDRTLSEAARLEACEHDEPPA